MGIAVKVYKVKG